MTKKLTKQAATLERTLTTINRTLGKGTILHIGDTSPLTVTTFSSGSLELDQALGGGHPRGRLVEIYGPESSGKTTLALQALAKPFQRKLT